MARAIRNFATVGEALDLPTIASARSYRGIKAGEPIFDGVRLRMQDGITAGGLSSALCRRRPVAVSGDITVKDVYIGVTQFTTPVITLVLPFASDFEAGQPLYIADETGLCDFNVGNTIAIIARGTDQINGNPSIMIGSAWQKLTFHCNGSNLWNYN